jgi:hypothetical protein
LALAITSERGQPDLPRFHQGPANNSGIGESLRDGPEGASSHDARPLSDKIRRTSAVRRNDVRTSSAQVDTLADASSRLAGADIRQKMEDEAQRFYRAADGARDIPRGAAARGLRSRNRPRSRAQTGSKFYDSTRRRTRSKRSSCCNLDSPGSWTAPCRR